MRRAELSRRICGDEVKAFFFSFAAISEVISKLFYVKKMFEDRNVFCKPSNSQEACTVLE